MLLELLPQAESATDAAIVGTNTFIDFCIGDFCSVDRSSRGPLLLKTTGGATFFPLAHRVWFAQYP